MLSRQRREIQSIAHSQPRRSEKEWVDYASKIVWVLMTITSFHFSSHLIMSRRNAAIKQQSDTGSDQQSIIKTLANRTCIGHKPIWCHLYVKVICSNQVKWRNWHKVHCKLFGCIILIKFFVALNGMSMQERENHISPSSCCKQKWQSVS